MWNIQWIGRMPWSESTIAVGSSSEAAPATSIRCAQAASMAS